MQPQEYYDGGEFLPLSVWKQRGFDEASIEQRSLEADKLQHPVLGLCYRVKTANVRRASSDLEAHWRLRMRCPSLLM